MKWLLLFFPLIQHLVEACLPAEYFDGTSC